MKFLAADCAEQTLALKECVDQYPEFFGAVFGGGPADSNEVVQAATADTTEKKVSEDGIHKSNDSTEMR